MEEETQPVPDSAAYVQLVQLKVPLDEAGDAFGSLDAQGRVPIVLIPEHLNRIRNEVVILGLLILIGGIIVGALIRNNALISIAIPVGIVLLLLGVYRSFMVRVPEGANALLQRAGRYMRTIGSGIHWVPPYIFVSHLVTRREIPFDVPVVASLTKDNVRANVDILITFSITDPYKFVFSIAPTDFDHVFQAACQDALRILLRDITAEQVIDLKREDLTPLLDQLNEHLAPYGVSLQKINVTYAMPPLEFVQAQEARQLAIVQQAEQEEKYALAQRRQADAEKLARQEVIATVEQKKEALQRKYQTAEARRKLAEMEAETEAYRLAKLEDRLAEFPHAAEWEMETLRLGIAQALAGNTRAMLQVGSADDIVRSFIIRNVMDSAEVEENGQPAAEAPAGTAGDERKPGQSQARKDS
jgi:regulator of protease activity HflC (stomatin/prohibitin superfamily)